MQYIFLSAILSSSLRQHLIPKNPLIMAPHGVDYACLEGHVANKIQIQQLNTPMNNEAGQQLLYLSFV